MPFNLSDLMPDEGSRRDKKRVGRGPGSGHGKTSGRGTKGQKARSGRGVRRGFEGGQLPIQQRLPYKRGFTNIHKTPWEVVNLNDFAPHGLQGEITPAILVERGLVRSERFPIKVLGDGELTSAITISAHAFSASARERIEAAGGTVTVLERTDEWVTAKPRSRRLPLNRELKQAGFGKVGGPQSREDVADA
jgi:large subunit ribosomal protein L15